MKTLNIEEATVGIEAPTAAMVEDNNACVCGWDASHEAKELGMWAKAKEVG